MNLKQKFVITINRELGSGGRTVGEKLAEKLGVTFYDKAVIKGLEEKYHLDVEEIERLKGQRQPWWVDFKRVAEIGIGFIGPRYDRAETGKEQTLTTENIFKAETEILLGIAESESCVIAGRSGFFVLRDHPNHLSILIQAPLEQRIQRIMKKQDLSREEAEKVIKKVDEMRENYVKKYTGTSRYDTRNYDIVISANGKTEDEIVDFILSFIG